MTENEAIERAIRCIVGACDETCSGYSTYIKNGCCSGYEEVAEGLRKALEEIQQYRTIGTVEECTKAVLNIEHFYMLGRNEAVDEFAGQLKKKYPRMEDCFGIPNVNYTLRKNIDEIAEQMKGGE